MPSVKEMKSKKKAIATGFGWPNAAEERNDYAVEVPRLGSLVLTHSWDGTIEPLSAVPPSERPPVAPVFWGFRIMVGIGLAMLALVVASAWAWLPGLSTTPMRPEAPV